MALFLPSRWTTIALPGMDVAMLPRIGGRPVRPTLMVFRWGEGQGTGSGLDLRGTPDEGAWTVGMDHWREGAWFGLRFLRVSVVDGSPAAEIRWMLWPEADGTGSATVDIWNHDPVLCVIATVGLEDLPLMDTILDTLVGRIPGDWVPVVPRGGPEDEFLRIDERPGAATSLDPLDGLTEADGWDAVPLAVIQDPLLELLRHHPEGRSWGRLNSEATHHAVERGLADGDGLRWGSWASGVASILQEPEDSARLTAFSGVGRQVRLELSRRADVTVVVVPKGGAPARIGTVSATRSGEMMFRAMGVVPAFSGRLDQEQVSLRDLVRRSMESGYPLPAHLAKDQRWEGLWAHEGFGLWLVESGRSRLPGSVLPLMILNAGSLGTYVVTPSGVDDVAVRPIQGAQLFTMLMSDLAGFVPGPYQRQMVERQGRGTEASA
ncbi:hypothetical protein [Microbacterium sp. A93]|uniref:hypothetical protein n=1 Tax=Microbacterium sp. A93 TaxID=3450716 RepID=UPI003F42F23E